MLHDPVDAFFQGMSSAFVRVPLAFVPLLAALSCFAFPNAELGVWALAAFPLVVLGVVLTWAAKGLVFFVGLCALLAYLVVSWRFLLTSHPKEMFLGLFVAAFVLFLPLAWGSEGMEWKPYALGMAFSIIYILGAYGLPILLERLHSRRNAD